MTAKYLDIKSGEIKKEPDFVKVYIHDVCKVHGLTSVQHQMFNFMLSNMNNDNLVSYGSKTKRDFLEKNKIKPQTFNNNISGLITSGLIERITRGEFRINKKYAAKVNWANVQSIEWNTVYTSKGKEEKITINKNE